MHREQRSIAALCLSYKLVVSGPVLQRRDRTLSRGESVDVEVVLGNGEQVVVVATHRGLRVLIAPLDGPPGLLRGADRGAEDRERVAVRPHELEERLGRLLLLRAGHARLLVEREGR